jgi:uncharacterized membrane protein
MSEWYYAENNEQKGPVNEAELKEKLAGNKLAADSLVWSDGMESWTPANQVAAFSFRAPPAPAKVQPSAAPAAAPAATDPTAPAPGNPESTQPFDVSALFGKPEALEVTVEDAEKNKVIGILAYLPFLFWIPLVAAKDSPFAKYHANQGFVLFIVSLTLWFVLTVLSLTCGFLFSFISTIIALLQLVYLGPFVLLVLGIINAASGKCVPLPVIGGIKIKIAK